MEYGFKAADYFNRAKARLAEARIESLFYAAFELRCGIEAKLKEYFDAQAQTTRMKREGWQIAKLAKQLESAFKSRDQLLRLVVIDVETNRVLSTALYTPVTRKLQKLGEQLGDYLHAPDRKKYENEQWLTGFRAKLNETYHELEFALSGTLMSPPLEHPQQPGKQFFCLFGDARMLFPSGTRIETRLEHFDINETK